MNLILIIVVCCLAALQATAAEEVVLDVHETVHLALTNNPALRAATLAVEQATARVQDAGRLSNPELESSFAPHIRGGESSFSFGFNQSFPITRRLASEKKLSRIQVALAEAEVAEFARNLALQVRTEAIKLSVLEAHRQLNERQLENSRSLEAAARAAAKVGEGSGIEPVQLQLESGRLTARRAYLERDFSESAGELKILLGLSPSIALKIAPLPPAPPPNELNDFFPTNRPDYQAALARVKAAGEGIKLARASRWEDVTVGLFSEIDRTEDVPLGFETDHIVELRVSMPIPLWNRRKGKMDEMRITSRRADLEAFALRAQIEAEIQMAIDQLRIETMLLKTISDDLLPQARQLEERLLELQRQGQSPFAEVLRAREKRLELESALLDAQRDVHLAHARYLAAIGKDEQ